jgi:hypothetical protein
MAKSIEFKSLPKGDFQGLHQFFVGTFLTIDARDLLNPPDPPLAFLLY